MAGCRHWLYRLAYRHLWNALEKMLRMTCKGNADALGLGLRCFYGSTNTCTGRARSLNMNTDSMRASEDACKTSWAFLHQESWTAAWTRWNHLQLKPTSRAPGKACVKLLIFQTFVLHTVKGGRVSQLIMLPSQNRFACAEMGGGGLDLLLYNEKWMGFWPEHECEYHREFWWVHAHKVLRWQEHRKQKLKIC